VEELGKTHVLLVGEDINSIKIQEAKRKQMKTKKKKKKDLGSNHFINLSRVQ
jgi:valyl-tRNA synthetase